MASHSWSTWPLSKWVANRINAYAALQDTVLTDTNALIRLLQGLEFEEDDTVLLSTADVESLYTSIPIPDALEAVGERLRACGVDETFLRITLQATEHVLRLNYFEFNGNVYKQVKGLAMGTPLAPPVANLFLASKEARLMREVSPPLLYARFLDDILVVQKLSGAEPEHLLWDGLHTMHPNIKLTRESSPCMVDFLDLQIYRDGKRLLHRVHLKALNKYLYISPRSCHPRHVIEGFVRTELIRYARNCSTELDFNRFAMPSLTACGREASIQHFSSTFSQVLTSSTAGSSVQRRPRWCSKLCSWDALRTMHSAAPSKSGMMPPRPTSRRLSLSRSCAI